MRESAYFLVRLTLLPLVFRRYLSCGQVTILTFHNPSRQTIALLGRHLQKHYTIYTLRQFKEILCGKSGDSLPPRPIVVTLDDGYKENALLVDVFRRYGIVPTVFLCPDLLDTDRDYWFREVNDKRVVREMKKLDNQERLKMLETLRQSRMLKVRPRVVLNRQEIEELKPWYDFQSHTLSHPILPSCSIGEVEFELSVSKTHLEKSFGLDIYALAYPNGTFGFREKQLMHQTGYSCGLGMGFGNNTAKTDPMELFRIPLNDNAGIHEIVVKTARVYDFFIKGFLGAKRYSY